MRRAITLSILCLAWVGCATSPGEAPSPTGKSLPYRVLVAPPENVLATLEQSENGEPRSMVEADTDSLERALLRALRGEGIFEDVSLLPDSEATPDGAGPVVREKADFLLETRLKRRVVSYVGRNGYFLPNLLLCVTAFPVAWWVKDEIYALDLEMDVDLRSWSSGIVMYSGVHRIRLERDLDDFDRGWTLLSTLRIPGALEAENWRQIDRALSPAGEQDLSEKVARRLAQEIRVAIYSPEFSRAFTNRYALVIGISQFDDTAVQGLRFADADARRFHDFLTGDGHIPAHNSRLLLNDQATLEQIRSTLKRFFALGAGEDDEIIIYYAGYGAWRGRRAYLLAHDTDSERLATSAFSLGDLADLASQIDGPRVTLVLDAPMASQFRGRSLAQGAQGSLEDALGTFLSRAGNQALISGNIGEACVELEDVGGGLFTHYLTQALEGKGDRNKDGKVTWEEAAAFAGWLVADHAPLEGKEQHPSYFQGNETASVGQP